MEIVQVVLDKKLLHAADQAASVVFGIDLTPLVEDENHDIVAYVTGFIEKFKADVATKLKR